MYNLLLPKHFFSRYLYKLIFTDFILTICIVEIYNKLYNATSKLQKSASNIGFIKKEVHLKVTPKFRLAPQFIDKQHKIDA